jgi:hypothetical protein
VARANPIKTHFKPCHEKLKILKTQTIVLPG